jgi:tetratricopeptide (TPR) repeat protein
MDEMTLAAQRLLAVAGPMLACGELDALATRLNAEWTPDCLVLLLGHLNPAVVRCAVQCLGVIAAASAASAIAALLHHHDEGIVDAAEDALWSISFQAGGPLPQRVLSKITESMKEGETENVIAMLTQLIKSHKSYAEAYHQRCQAYYLQQAYEPALRDARRAFSLNPFHFSALAVQGHCMVALGRLPDALEIYRRVLALHPRMADISDCIEQLRRKLTPQSNWMAGV